MGRGRRDAIHQVAGPENSPISPASITGRVIYSA